MDLFKVIQALVDEKHRLSEVIAFLETMQPKSESGRIPRQRVKRGRKSMNPAERAAVSRRMKEYWLKRREAGTGQVKTQAAGGNG